MDAPEVLRVLGSSEGGLSDEEAAGRLAALGDNRLPEARRRGALVRFLVQFNNLLIYALLASAAMSLGLGHVSDACFILAVVLLNAVIGFIQGGRAERALDAIRGMVDPRATVSRGGRRLGIAADAVVPGDMVLIKAGDRVPADLRLVHARGLRVDEAALTGESVPVEKMTEATAADTALSDRKSMAFSGTLVVAGQGRDVVVASGALTELGRVGALLRTVESLKTPLILQMDRLALHLTVAILAVSALSFVFAVTLRGYALEDAFMIVVGLAVAAIPEGLPAILTITLAIGVRRMATRHAIIRRLPAVETLGAVSVICSDKTGTLTRNEMAARALVKADGSAFVPSETGSATGAGPRTPEFEALLRTAVLCNDAEIHVVSGVERIESDPMEGALVRLGRQYGVDPVGLRARMHRLDEIPFDAAHRFMATLHAGLGTDGALAQIKGAPEQVIEMCSGESSAETTLPIERSTWHGRATSLASEGYRVLAFASKRVPRTDRLTFDDVRSGETIDGLVGFIDPPRPEGLDVIAECRRAGVGVVMITGDHAETVRAIARQLGLGDKVQVLTGRDVDALDAAGLRAALTDAAVFARTSPEHELRLVETLQADGLTVAMTGDGVNDAPALKRADIGVAMGRKGTGAAKEASDMVLADDNFSSIVAAVREGRTVYDNIRKVVAWTLPTNGGEALGILTALALGLALPVTPIQILWINMVTAVTLGLALAFEPTEPAAMSRPPRRRDGPILAAMLVWRVAFSPCWSSSSRSWSTPGRWATARTWRSPGPWLSTPSPSWRSRTCSACVTNMGPR